MLAKLFPASDTLHICTFGCKTTRYVGVAEMRKQPPPPFSNAMTMFSPENWLLTVKATRPSLSN